MSQTETARQVLITAITAAVPAGVSVLPINSEPDFRAALRQPPAIGVAYVAKQHEPAPKTIGNARQSIAAWHYEVYVAASGPAAGVIAGQDAYSLLEAIDAALEGLSFVLGTQTVVVRAGGEQFVDLLVGGLLFVQGWQFWQQG